MSAFSGAAGRTEPLRVAIVGGGCAAMAAAFELSHPRLEGRYRVTVYQQGWRLGGKGASGRGAFGRIEEHGLHIWMGFYENAFRLMREVYAELERDPRVCPLARWTDAFSAFDHVGLAHRGSDSSWSSWSALFPPLPGAPGDGLSPGFENPFSVTGYLVRATEVMGALFRVAYGPQLAHRGPMWRTQIDSIEALLETAQELLRTTIGAGAALLAIVERQLDTAFAFARALRANVADTRIAKFLERVLEATRATLRQIEPAGSGEEVHRTRASEVLEVMITSVLGAVRSSVHLEPSGFDVLDSYDFSEFLLTQGASPAAATCPFVRGLYSLMFAYEDGDAERPRTAAGQALRGCLRMFLTYRGSIFYRMNAGMGDAVFAPIYEVLKQRGVRFEFFHRLNNIRLSDASAAAHVAALDFDVQARVRGGREYEPLLLVRGVPSWPAEPDWGQLEDGERLFREDHRFESFWDRRRATSRTLEVVRDFDFVVLGVGLGAVPHVAAELIARDPRWRDMVRSMKSVATQALQLWMRPDIRQLGWHKGSIVMTGFESPFDTWADMTHLEPREDWPTDGTPGSIAYFCNVLSEAELERLRPGEPGFDERARALVESNALRFVDRQLHGLWPEAVDTEGTFRWNDVTAQFISSNVNPTDRYTLCLPNTPALRISPLDPTYDNFSVCGDWTSCGLNLGCVESAVMSGLLAAHAICGLPRLESIIGYDHP